RRREQHQEQREPDDAQLRARLEVEVVRVQRSEIDALRMAAPVCGVGPGAGADGDVRLEVPRRDPPVRSPVVPGESKDTGGGDGTDQSKTVRPRPAVKSTSE